MPLPNPKPKEKQSDFIARCVANEKMISEFPKERQRIAVCYNQWREKKMSEEKQEEVKVEAEAQPEPAAEPVEQSTPEQAPAPQGDLCDQLDSLSRPGVSEGEERFMKDLGGLGGDE